MGSGRGGWLEFLGSRVAWDGLSRDGFWQRRWFVVAKSDLGLLEMTE